jgi:hypothetical protein
MTTSEVINKLSMELAFMTGDLEDIKHYKKYIRMALAVGIEHFTKDMEEIIVMTRAGVEVGRFKSVTEASKRTGIRQCDVSNVLTGVQHSAGGFLFMKEKNKILVKAENEYTKSEIEQINNE